MFRNKELALLDFDELDALFSKLTPEEIEERRIRYKGDRFKHEYTRLYQQCYYQRPEIKQHKTEYNKQTFC